MPRKVKRKVHRRRRRHYGGDDYDLRSLGENNYKALQQINTADNNIDLTQSLQSANPPLQDPGNIARPVGIFGNIKDYLKKTKIISRGARYVSDRYGLRPAHKIADYAEMHGYGRRRHRRHHRGGNTYHDKYGAYVYVPNLINI